MSSAEKKVIEWIEKNTNILFFAIISFMGIYVRYVGRDFISADMQNFLLPWYDEIKQSGGFKALNSQVGDYNILYQTIISLMTYLSINSVYLYKLLSIVFDFALAISSACFVCEISKKEKMGVLFQSVYAVVLFLPTVILNSAFWGQCDSIYTFFIVLTLFNLYKEKYIKAFIYFGIAFGFKIQTVFILPFVVSYYLYKKKFSITMFGVSILSFWVTGIFGYINGRSILAPFEIYMNQTDTYHSMYLNVNSFWRLLGDNYDAMKDLAICTTLIICGLGLFLILSKRKKMDTGEQMLNSAVWFVWVCILFLPAMHERYTFPLDILLILLAFINVKYVKYALSSVVLSLLTYGAYLVGNEGIDKWCTILYIFAWVYYTYSIVKQDSAEIIEEEN